MTFYAIRNKTNGRFLTLSKQRNQTSAELSSKKAPRLFTKKYAATQALKWWAEGEWYNHGDSYDRDTGLYVSRLNVEPKWNRRLEDMEIVEIEILIKVA